MCGFDQKQVGYNMKGFVENGVSLWKITSILGREVSVPVDFFLFFC